MQAVKGGQVDFKCLPVPGSTGLLPLTLWTRGKQSVDRLCVFGGPGGWGAGWPAIRDEEECSGHGAFVAGMQ